MPMIQVWAPNVQDVALHTPEANIAMTAQPNGWWLCPQALAHGQDYGFVIDEEGPYPDPRSLWQPHGVHGLSRVYDEDFHWSDQNWQRPPNQETVIYELHVGTFSPQGTFAGILEKLDHLKELGITHIELLPIAEFAGDRGWGYDGVQLFAPHHCYGTPSELKAFVNACHNAGLGVILDVVYNHLGPSGNYLGHYAPYFQSQYHTPWGQAINFDGFHSPEVRRFFIDNALMWLKDYHFDGLRLDAVQTILDGSAIHFLEQLAEEVNALSEPDHEPHILIAESHMNDGRLMREPALGGYGLQAQWHDDFHHSIYAYLTGAQAGYFQDYGAINQISKVLNQGVYFEGQYCEYRKRALGRPAEGLSGLNFVAYIQNHDQVGNRPGGERLSHLLNLGQLKIAAALLLTSPFIPMLFQGEEWGAKSPFLYFTDHQEEHLGRAVKRGRKQEAIEFGWPITHFSDPQQPNSYTRSLLSWSDLEQSEHQELLDWYKLLLRLRNRHADLQAGEFLQGQAKSNTQYHALNIARGAFEIVCNCSETTQSIAVLKKGARITAASDPKIELQQSGSDSHVILPAHSVVILDNLEMAIA